MEHAGAANPALTVSVALAAGLIAQVVAHHVRIPGIVLLLVTGALLGPDLLDVVRPDTLGSALQALVGFAVAVVLFEGGLNLNRTRLRRESRTIRRFITVGALVTAAGATLAAHWIMHWEWRSAILFGTLVIVTGPTVVGPLIRRIRLKRSLETVLEGEGVLIDAVGAIVAVVVLDVALRPSFPSVAIGALEIFASLGVGSALGFVGGWIIARLLRLKNWIPDGLQNVFTLSMILALFHLANAVQAEAGIASVTVAGIVVGNTKTRVHRDLMEFKEQLTVMLIGMLFVILAADVRFAEIRSLGAGGALTVLALMFVVRPLNVLAATWRSELSWRDRAFLSWMAPRGIVAAAVASFFAVEMERAGMQGGSTLRAMVFLVIAVTVTVQGLTGGLLARALGLRRATDRGYAILGASALGLALGRALRTGGEEVVFLDSNVDASHAAEDEGFRVVFGNALEDSTLARARLDGLAGCVSITANEEVNLLFATKVREEYKVSRAYAALQLNEGHVNEAMLQESGVHALFGGARDLRLWESCLRRNLGLEEEWRYEGGATESDEPFPSGELTGVLLPLARTRSARTAPIDETAKLRSGDRVAFLVFGAKREEADEWLSGRGWVRSAEAPTEPAAA
jgi:NhaP-type Na+/H+ or K+/H+ antiporter